MSSRWRWLLVAVVLAAPQTACARVTFEIPEYEIPEDNAWDYYLEAFELVPSDGELWARVQFASGEPLRRDVRSLLEAGQPALAKLREGLGKPCVPPDEGPGSALGRESLRRNAKARSMARLLRWEGWLHAQHADFAAAFRSQLDGITLGQDVARQGGLIAKLNSIACEGIACLGIRQTVGQAAGDEAALGVAVEGLSDVEAREVPYWETLATQYVIVTDYLRWMRSAEGKEQVTREAFQQRFGTRAVGATTILTRRELDRRYSEAVAAAQRPSWKWSSAPTGESDQRPARTWRQAEPRQQPVARSAPRDPEPPTLTPRQQERRDRQIAALKRKLMKLFMPENQTLAGMLSPDPRLRLPALRHLATLRGTLLVAALELHRARHGAYPGSLSDLVPETLAELPRDPWCGEPFRYSRGDADTYTLYSVGENLKDDGGHDRWGQRSDLVFSTDN